MKTQERTTTLDKRLTELVGQHAVRSISGPTTPFPHDAFVEPAGMSIEDEEELAVLIQLAEPTRDGDEDAAIERLVDVLEEAQEHP